MRYWKQAFAAAILAGLTGWLDVKFHVHTTSTVIIFGLLVVITRYGRRY